MNTAHRMPGKWLLQQSAVGVLQLPSTYSQLRRRLKPTRQTVTGFRRRSRLQAHDCYYSGISTWPTVVEQNHSNVRINGSCGLSKVTSNAMVHVRDRLFIMSTEMDNWKYLVRTRESLE